MWGTWGYTGRCTAVLRRVYEELRRRGFRAAYCDDTGGCIGDTSLLADAAACAAYTAMTGLYGGVEHYALEEGGVATAAAICWLHGVVVILRQAEGYREILVYHPPVSHKNPAKHL